MRNFFARDRSSSASLGHLAVALLVGSVLAAGATALLREAEASQELQRSVAFGCFALPLVLLVAIRRLGPVEDPVATVAAAVALCVIAVAGLTYVGAIDADPAEGCINTHGDLDATVSGDPTVIYEEASAASRPVGMLRRGCEVHAVKWCVGAVHDDGIEGNRVFDTRWLVLPDDQGLVPNGRTVGPPLPEDERDDNCRGGVERPREIRFDRAVVDARGGFIALYARADRAAFIGFVVRRGEDRWQRIGWEYEPADDEPVVLAMPDPPPSVGDEVNAVACIGYQQPAVEDGAVVLQSRTLTSGRGLSTERPGPPQPIARTPEAAACDAAIPIPSPPYEPGVVSP